MSKPVLYIVQGFVGFTSSKLKRRRSYTRSACYTNIQTETLTATNTLLSSMNAMA